MLDRLLRPLRPIDLRSTLASAVRGSGDPTARLFDGEVWRATRTPAGPASVRLRSAGREVLAEAWGPGAQWSLETVPDLIGMNDDLGSFRPRHPQIAALHRRFSGFRIARSRAVVETLIPSILEQKVAGTEARRSYRQLALALGEAAPGPLNLVLPPDPEVLATLPYYEFHRFGIERKRAEIIRRVCSVRGRLEEAADLSRSDAARLLMAVPGVGRWTAAEVGRVALGDPDALSVGDYHLPHLVTWVVAGEPRGTDARMLELLEPYVGHRGRVTRLLELSGEHPPRRGPRRALRSIARI